MAALSKMGWATLVALAASVVGVLWIVDPRPQPRPDASPVPALEDESEPTTETPAPSAKDVWAQRRALLRRKHASHPPSPDVDARDDTDDDHGDGEEIQALIDEANEAREAAFDECQKDIGRGRGALVLRYRVLGAPDVGTIIDIIDVVGDTEYRTELVECVQESMYTFLGGFPPVPFERTETVTYVGPRAEDQDEKTWKERIFQTVVTAHLSEVRACETTGHGPDSEVAGRVTLEMSFGREPNAMDARIVQTDTPASVSDCILTAARTWMFPRPVLDGHTFTRDIALPIDPAVDDVAQAE